MWISLFFLQAILVLVLGEDNCIQDILKCDGYRVTFFERVYSRFLIERPTQLRRKCRALEPFMDCLQEATLNCLREGLSQTEAEFIQTRRFVKQLCVGSDETLKESFLKSADCINEHLGKMEETCDTAELRDMISELVPALNFSCEYQRALLKCKASVVGRECGVNASSLFTRTMNLELNMDYVCMDKTNFKEPAGFLSDIINGLVILLVDAFKPLLRLPKDAYVKETTEDPTSPPTLDEQSVLTNQEMEEMSFESVFDDGIVNVDKSSHQKRKKGKKVKYEYDLRRIGNIMEDIKSEPNGKAFTYWNAESLSAIKFYKSVLREVALILEKREQRLSSVIGNCHHGKCGKSKFRGKRGGFESKSSGSDEFGNAVPKDPEAYNYKVEFKDEKRFVADEDREETDGSRMKINFMVVGEAHLPLEINYSDGDHDYTQIADIKISTRRYRLTPSTETVPSMNSEDVEPSTVYMSGTTKTQECELVKEKHNVYLADNINENVPEEPTCEMKSNATPQDIRPQGTNVRPQQFLTSADLNADTED